MNSASIVKKGLFALIAIVVAVVAVVISMAFFSPAVVAEEEEEIRYTDAVMLSRDSNSVVSEYVNYSAMTITDEVKIAKKVACYVTELANSCGPIAASNIVAYYDITYTNLIPNFDPILIRDRYKPSDYAEADAVINTMYSNMRCNQIQNGVSEPDYHSGFTAYVQSKGYSISYPQLVSNGSLDIAALKAQLNSGHPVSLFCLGGAIVQINAYDSNTIVYTNIKFTSNHIAAVYGYQEYTFTMSDGSTRVDRFALVSTGWASPSYAYIALDGSTYIKSATAAVIG